MPTLYACGSRPESNRWQHGQEIDMDKYSASGLLISSLFPELARILWHSPESRSALVSQIVRGIDYDRKRFCQPIT
jgi:hypothetical protein